MAGRGSGAARIRDAGPVEDAGWGGDTALVGEGWRMVGEGWNS
ncbi:hypothetical protein [Streptomyces sp. NPDC048392]